MQFITLDFESHYSKEYSLRKLTPAEYVLNDQFELICCAATVDFGEPIFIDGPDFPAWLSQFDPKETITLCYNALFDNVILAWRYNYIPARMVDGLGLARVLLGHKLPRLGLEFVAEHLGVGKKGDTIHTVIGMHRADIMAQPALWRSFQEYNKQDVVLLNGIFKILAPQYPKAEWRIMDLVLRCCVEPVFEADIDLLNQHLNTVIAEKDELLASVGLGRTVDGKMPAELMTTEGFRTLLEQQGITVETKITATGNEIPALAKSDDFMAELAEHPDPYVQALAAARLGAKSTLEESRCRRLISIASLPWPNGKPMLPIPLRLGGAHTQRLSGDWKINMQNLPAGRGGKSSALRHALKAPEGYTVIVSDLGQIEARLTAWFCRGTVLMDAFRNNKDPYVLLACEIFARMVTKADKLERFVGKSGILGLGFGLGKANFYIKTGAGARAQGLDLGEFWTQTLADRTVATYRRINKEIPQMWDLLGQILRTAWLGRSAPITLGPLEIGQGYVRGPGGLEMCYDECEQDASGEFWFKYGKRKKKLYGAAFLENIIQFLARIIQMNAALRLDSLGLRMRHTVHDELIMIVRDEDVEHASQMIHQEMTRAPSWAPDLPLTADVGVGKSYGSAKT